MQGTNAARTVHTIETVPAAPQSGRDEIAETRDECLAGLGVSAGPDRSLVFDFSRAEGHSFLFTHATPNSPPRLLDKRELQSDTPPQRSRWVVAAVIVGLAAFCAIVEASQNYIGAINFGRPVPWRESIRRTLPSWIIIAFLTPGALYLARKFAIDRDRWRSSLVVHLLGASAFALAHLGGTAVFYAMRDGSYANLPLLLNKFISAYFILDVLI